MAPGLGAQATCNQLQASYQLVQSSVPCPCPCHRHHTNSNGTRQHPELGSLEGRPHRGQKPSTLEVPGSTAVYCSHGRGPGPLPTPLFCPFSLLAALAMTQGHMGLLSWQCWQVRVAHALNTMTSASQHPSSGYWDRPGRGSWGFCGAPGLRETLCPPGPAPLAHHNTPPPS